MRRHHLTSHFFNRPNQNSNLIFFAPLFASFRFLSLPFTSFYFLFIAR